MRYKFDLVFESSLFERPAHAQIAYEASGKIRHPIVASDGDHKFSPSINDVDLARSGSFKEFDLIYEWNTRKQTHDIGHFPRRFRYRRTCSSVEPNR